MRALNVKRILLNLVLNTVSVHPAARITDRAILGHVAAKVGSAICTIPVLRTLKALGTLAVSFLLRVLSVAADQ